MLPSPLTLTSPPSTLLPLLSSLYSPPVLQHYITSFSSTLTTVQWSTAPTSLPSWLAPTASSTPAARSMASTFPTEPTARPPSAS
ncbi:hypothetical protein HYQ46_012700 [Verticillium longisporum]|nr:hypothetical protein HYQ46_012700 [Verticillium longisporum]